jgi:hypothetical protein
MKRKILTILVSMLFITMIPSVIGDIIEPDSEDEIIYMRGLLFRCSRLGNVNNAIAIHLVVWYNTSSGLQREVYWFEPVTFKDSLYMGRMYEIGAGLFTFLFGLFAGGLEIA